MNLPVLFASVGTLLCFVRWDARGFCWPRERKSSSLPFAVAADIVAVFLRSFSRAWVVEEGARPPRNRVEIVSGSSAMVLSFLDLIGIKRKADSLEIWKKKEKWMFKITTKFAERRICLRRSSRYEYGRF